MRNTPFFFALLFFVSLMQPISAQQSNMNVHSYIQTRFSNDFNKTNDFMIRRAKLWVDGTITGMDHVSYKIQTVYRSFKDEALMFQDALVDVKMTDIGFVCIGRFVPDFMLQRMQPDYVIADIERANVISGFVHDSNSMARQIGAQFTFEPNASTLHFSIGVFNGNLSSPGTNNSRQMLYTSRLHYAVIKNTETTLEAGCSASYRYVRQLSMSNLYPPTSLITGNDLRGGIEIKFQQNDFGVQSEYLRASIHGETPWGYYISSDYSLSENVLLLAGVEKLSDRNPATEDNEWWSIGMNYFFTKKTKLQADFKTQTSRTTNNYLAEIQFQVFLF